MDYIDVLPVGFYWCEVGGWIRELRSTKVGGLARTCGIRAVKITVATRHPLALSSHLQYFSSINKENVNKDLLISLPDHTDLINQ